MKAYTSLEQSEKLAEILPLESADMEYLAIKENGELIGSVPFVKDDSEVEDSAYSHTYDRIACWSLVALLGTLPEPSLIQNQEGSWMLRIWDKKRFHFSIGGHINPIDACCEMILKLNELNLL